MNSAKYACQLIAVDVYEQCQIRFSICVRMNYKATVRGDKIHDILAIDLLKLIPLQLLFVRAES